jgi:hypothetical protein
LFRHPLTCCSGSCILVGFAADDANPKISRAFAGSALRMHNIPTANNIDANNRSNLIPAQSEKLNMLEEILSIRINDLRNYQHIV